MKFPLPIGTIGAAMANFLPNDSIDHAIPAVILLVFNAIKIIARIIAIPKTLCTNHHIVLMILAPLLFSASVKVILTLKQSYSLLPVDSHKGTFSSHHINDKGSSLQLVSLFIKSVLVISVKKTKLILMANTTTTGKKISVIISLTFVRFPHIIFAHSGCFP